MSGDLYNSANPIIFGVPYDDIKSGDVNTVLSALNSFLDTRERLIWARARFTILFEGYDDDPRDVWDILEVREYVKKLDAEFPYWFYFTDLNHHTLKVICLCLCRVMKVEGSSTPHPDDLKHFLASRIIALNNLCSRFHLADEVKNEITQDVCEHLAPR